MSSGEPSEAEPQPQTIEQMLADMQAKLKAAQESWLKSYMTGLPPIPTGLDDDLKELFNNPMFNAFDRIVLMQAQTVRLLRQLTAGPANTSGGETT